LSTALKLSSYFTIVIGFCFSLYFLSTVEFFKWAYTLITLAITLPIGFGGIVLSRIYDTTVANEYDTTSEKHRTKEYEAPTNRINY
jgi:Na+/H+ antiporter NhaB